VLENLFRGPVRFEALQDQRSCVGIRRLARCALVSRAILAALRRESIAHHPYTTAQYLQNSCAERMVEIKLDPTHAPILVAWWIDYTSGYALSAAVIRFGTDDLNLLLCFPITNISGLVDN
jgi:hypothetical protein